MPDHDETTLDVEATLEIDPRDVHIIDGWDVEQLRHKVWEMLETSVKVTIRRGEKPIRATLRFGTPTPYELKVARLGGENSDG